MAQNSKIEWCTHTMNFWTGCTKVSEACDNCYAEGWDKRMNGGKRWGPHAERVRTSESYWQQPYKWDRLAAAAGEQHKVFTLSLGDFFDNKADPAWRADAWKVMKATPNLIWLILTKRPGNIPKMLPEDWGDGYPNIWLGTTVEHQKAADMNIPALLAAPAVVHFLSMEPLLEDVTITKYLKCYEIRKMGQHNAALQYDEGDYAFPVKHIDWVICGGESGPKARPMHPDWARSLREQCQRAGVPFFFKQWGEWLRKAEAEDIVGIDDRRMSDSQSRRGGHAALMEFEDDIYIKVGKKDAGRHLDGRTWDEYPATTLQAAANRPE